MAPSANRALAPNQSLSRVSSQALPPTWSNNSGVSSGSELSSLLMFDFGIRRTLVRRQASEIKDKNFIWILGEKNVILSENHVLFNRTFGI